MIYGVKGYSGFMELKNLSTIILMNRFIKLGSRDDCVYNGNVGRI